MIIGTYFSIAGFNPTISQGEDIPCPKMSEEKEVDEYNRTIGDKQMKKIIIILSFMITIYIPRVSHPQDDEVTKNLVSLSVHIGVSLQLMASNLRNIEIDMAKLLLDKIKSKDMIEYGPLTLSAEATATAYLICYYEAYLLTYFPLPELEKALFAYHIMQRDRIKDISKFRLSRILKGLQYYFGDLKDKPSLYLVDKAKENIRTSIMLLDEGINLLEANIEKLEKMNKSTKSEGIK